MSGIARTERDGECASQFTEQGRRVFVDAYDQPDCAAALHEVRARISEPTDTATALTRPRSR
jgi:hypothetical protein